MTTTIDTPEGIQRWYLLSAISQLGLELSTGRNFYGKTSVYKGIRLNLVDGLPERATLRNKCLAMVTLLQHAPAGPVAARAQAALAKVLSENGWVITAPHEHDER